MNEGLAVDTLGVGGESEFRGNVEARGGVHVAGGVESDILSVSGSTLLKCSLSASSGASVTGGLVSDTLNVDSITSLNTVTVSAKHIVPRPAPDGPITSIASSSSLVMPLCAAVYESLGKVQLNLFIISNTNPEEYKRVQLVTDGAQDVDMVNRMIVGSNDVGIFYTYDNKLAFRSFSLSRTVAVYRMKSLSLVSPT